MANILQALKGTKKANKMLSEYYTGTQDNNIVELFILLGWSKKQNKKVKYDIRLCYGVFVVFLSTHGILIDVNTKGYSVYVNETNKEYQGKGRDFLFEQIEGNYYIAHKYITKNNYIIPKRKVPYAIQYNMFNAIVDAMVWLNIN